MYGKRLEDMTATELAAYWRNEDEAAIVILNTLAAKDEQIAELGKENRKLIQNRGIPRPSTRRGWVARRGSANLMLCVLA